MLRLSANVPPQTKPLPKMSDVPSALPGAKALADLGEPPISTLFTLNETPLARSLRSMRIDILAIILMRSTVTVSAGDATFSMTAVPVIGIPLEYSSG